MLHSQRMIGTPLHGWFIVEKSGKILSGHYNCMVGIGETCTHVACINFILNWSCCANTPYFPVSDIDFTAPKTKKKKIDPVYESTNFVSYKKSLATRTS